MKVDLLDREMVNSDLGVVNAARCSFDKESTWDYVCTDKTCTGTESCSREHITPVIKAADAKLIKYLAQHQHWTPFAHAQEVFEIDLTDTQLLNFFLNANLSGFEWIDTAPWQVRGSLYAWLTNMKHLPGDIGDTILTYLLNKYPISTRSIIKRQPGYPSQRVQVIASLEASLKSYTLRIHCPIFVKRQLETHRRNFVMTDIEDFSQNEVSRRYIDTEPEVYTPPQWRVQSASKKQGSSEEILQGMEKFIIDRNYEHNIHISAANYRNMNSKSIAHEQSRMILPLSTYTTFWFTGSLKSWKRLLALRLDTHAQSETQALAYMIYEVLKQDRVEL